MLLIGRDLSPFVRRTAITLLELGLGFERRKLAAQPDAEEVSRFNPLRRVPALQLDDGDMLVDSNAVTDFALDHAGTLGGASAAQAQRLLPATGLPRRQVLQVVGLALGVMEKAVASSYEVRLRPAEKVHQPWLENITDQTGKGLQALESLAGDARIAGRHWLCGDDLSLADICAVVAYDFTTIVLGELTVQAAPQYLAELSQAANQRAAFNATRWQGD